MFKAPTKRHYHKSNKRKQIDPTTCERDYTADELEFMQALESYKRSSGRKFPTCSEILEVLRSIGYEKTNQPSNHSEQNDDSSESSDSSKSRSSQAPSARTRSADNNPVHRVERRLDAITQAIDELD